MSSISDSISVNDGSITARHHLVRAQELLGAYQNGSGSQESLIDAGKQLKMAWGYRTILDNSELSNLFINSNGQMYEACTELFNAYLEIISLGFDSYAGPASELAGIYPELPYENVGYAVLESHNKKLGVYSGLASMGYSGYDALVVDLIEVNPFLASLLDRENRSNL